MAKYFRLPFGVDGDRTTVPDPVQPSGAVSYDQGFGPDYQLDPASDPAALNVPRNEFNEIIYQTQLALQQYQQFGFPDFITTSDNNGTPFAYSAFAFVRYSGLTYYSLVDSNTALPTDATKWQVFPTSALQSFRTADVVQTYDSTLPAGWLWLDGKTIGSAASGATSRANADTQALFSVLWASLTNTVLPIQDSTGAASTRGISAAADFSANKRLPVPDERGRVAAAADNLGGTAANRLTAAQAGGVNGAVLGNAGGEQGHQLITAELASHGHGTSGLTTSTAGAHTHDLTLPTGVSGVTSQPVAQYNSSTSAFTATGTTQSAGAHTHSITGSTDNTGGDTAHNTVQPTIISNKRIKL